MIACSSVVELTGFHHPQLLHSHFLYKSIGNIAQAFIVSVPSSTCHKNEVNLSSSCFMKAALYILNA